MRFYPESGVILEQGNQILRTWSGQMVTVEGQDAGRIVAGHGQASMHVT